MSIFTSYIWLNVSESKITGRQNNDWSRVYCTYKDADVQLLSPTLTRLAFLHLSRDREGRGGTTVDFTTRFFHFFLFSTALWDLANSRPVHSLMMSSHLFLCLPCLLSPFTVPCKVVLARPEDRETSYHCCLRLLTMVRRSLCGPIACWILARTLSLVTCYLYEMCSILL